MRKSNLRNWTLFIGGERIDGAHEYTAPDMSIIVTDIRTGGMDTSRQAGYRAHDGRMPHHNAGLW